MKREQKRKSYTTKGRLVAFALTTMAVTGFSLSVGVGHAFAEAPEAQPPAPVVENITGDVTKDVIAIGHTFINLPFNPPAKVVGTGTLNIHGTMVDKDDKVRVLDKKQGYTGEYKTEDRERHHLIAAMGKGEVDLNGNDQSTYNVDAIVSTSGGNINITGKSITTNLVYMTTPLASSKYYHPGYNGVMNIKLTGDLIAHNDDWDKFPRMDGFHYHHSSNLYSRGGIAVNGDNELNIEANKIETRYLRNSDYHHGDGKAKVNIKANELVINKMGRSSYTDDGKNDEQWVVGKTEDDKGGMFQFYNATVNIDVKKATIGGVYPGMKPRKDIPEDRIDIDAGNRAHININSPRMEEFNMDGEIRSIDGASVDIVAQKSLKTGSAFAGYTDNYRYGKYVGSDYKEGIYYYKSTGDVPNNDTASIHLKAPNVELHVAHQAEEGGYNHVGFGYAGAAQHGELDVEALNNLHIYNDWNGFEGHGPTTKTVLIDQGGKANFSAENVIVEGKVQLGEISKDFDIPKQGGGYNSVYAGENPNDDLAGALTFKGHGKDKGNLLLEGSVDGVRGNLNIEDFKTVTTGAFTGFDNDEALGATVSIKNVENVIIDATNEAYQKNHEGKVYDKNIGRGYVAFNSFTSRENAKNELNVEADNIQVKGILASSGQGSNIHLLGNNIDLYRVASGYNTNTEIKAKDTLTIATDVKSLGGAVDLEGKNIRILGKDYYVDAKNGQYSDKGTVAAGKNGYVLAESEGTLRLNVLPQGVLQGGVYGEDESNATVTLNQGATWSDAKESQVQQLVNNGFVDLTAKDSKLDVTNTYDGSGTVVVPDNATEAVFTVNSLKNPDSVLHLAVRTTAPDTTKEQSIVLANVKDTTNLKGYHVDVIPAAKELVAYTAEAKTVEEGTTTDTALTNGNLDIVLSKFEEAGPSEVVSDSATMLQGAGLAFLTNMQSQESSRLQALRNGHSRGVWANLQRDQLNWKDTGWQGNTIVGGVDGSRAVKNGEVYGGMLISHRAGHTDVLATQNDVSQTGVGLYGGYKTNNGAFIDGGVHYGRGSLDSQVPNAQVNLSGHTWSMGMTAGKVFTNGNSYVTPHAGLSYGRWSMGDATGMDTIHYSDVYSKATLSNVGIEVGNTQGNRHVYGGVSYFHKLSGESHAYLSDGTHNMNVAAPLPSTWWEANIGGAFTIRPSVQLNLDLSKQIGKDMNSGLKGSVQLNIKY